MSRFNSHLGLLLSCSVGAAAWLFLRLWLPAELSTVLAVDGCHGQPVFSGDSRRLAILRLRDEESEIAIYSTAGIVQARFAAPEFFPRCWTFSLDGLSLVIGSGNEVRLWHISTGKETQRWRVTSHLQYSFQLCSYEKAGIRCLDFPALRATEIPSGEVVWEIRDKKYTADGPFLPGMAVFHDGEQVLLRSVDGQSKGGFTVPQHHRFIPTDITPDGRYLAGYHSTGWSELVHILFDMRSNTLKPLPWAKSTDRVVLSPDGRLAGALKSVPDGQRGLIDSLLLIEIASQKTLAVLPGGAFAKFSPDGKRIAVVSNRGLTLWEFHPPWTCIWLVACVAGFTTLVIVLCIGLAKSRTHL